MHPTNWNLKESSEKTSKTDEDSLKNLKALYVMEFENGYVKIGISKDVQGRRKVLEYEQKSKVIKCRCTDLMKGALYIERELHKFFDEFRAFGEYFSCSFEDVLNECQRRSLTLKAVM